MTIKIITYTIILCALLSTGCIQKPEPDTLSLSTISVLNLLQEDPQFVMYINFKNMRRTEFWNKNISDSLLNAEKTFGSLLYTFKLATGASISDGVDELYYSNSWFGENAIVMKGIMNQNLLNDFISRDTVFSVAKTSQGKTIYLKNDNGLYFYFRDDNTICASNYLKQLDAMMNVTDTVKNGILLNQKVYDAIEKINYKQDIWMVSTEKIFIKGIFRNFIESNAGIKMPENDSSEVTGESSANDSISEKNLSNIENLYKNIESVSFSSKMTNELNLLIQCECVNSNSSKYLRSLLNGFLTVAKLSSSGKGKSNINSILEKIKLNRFDNSVFVELNVDESNLNELKKLNLINEPE